MDKLLQALKSKTVWFGLLTALLAWVQSTVNGAGLSPDQLGLVGTVMGLVTIWLRTKTTQPLSEK
jgi:hypothetical protein